MAALARREHARARRASRGASRSMHVTGGGRARHPARGPRGRRARERRRGPRLRGRVELREALGSEVLVHFTIAARQAVTDDMRELAEDVGDDRVVGQLASEGCSPTRRASSGGSARGRACRGRRGRGRRRPARAALLRPRDGPGDPRRRDQVWPVRRERGRPRRFAEGSGRARPFATAARAGGPESQFVRAVVRWRHEERDAAAGKSAA